VRSLEYYGLVPSVPSTFSPSMRAAIADMVVYAAANKGRTLLIEVPGGEYTHDGSTINVPPFAKFRWIGPVLLNCDGVTGGQPVFWIRPDLAGYKNDSQYTSAASNAGKIFDGSGGALIMKDLAVTAGGCAIRQGAGDGFYGTLYVPSDSNPAYSIFYEIDGVVIRGFDQPLQYTNYQTFCMRHRNVRVDGAYVPITTSTAAGYDFGELSTFENCFFSNSMTCIANMNSAHQFSFIGCSFPFSAGNAFEINADRVRLQFTNSRFEGVNKVSNSSGSYPRSIVAMSNCMVLPTKKSGSTTLPYHMRPFHTGVHQVSIDGLIFDLPNSTLDPAYTAAANLYCVDSSVVISARNVRMLQTSTAPFLTMPILTMQSLVPNHTFTSNANGWHQGTNGTVAYLGTDGSTATGCLSITASANQVLAYSPRAKVQAGKLYGADALFKIVSTSSPSASFSMYIRIAWYRDGDQFTLGSAPLSVTSGSTSVVVSKSNHGLRVGDWVGISGAVDTGGIVAANINGSRRVIAVTGISVFTIEAGAAASSTTTGGGTTVVLNPPVSYVGYTSYGVRTYTSAYWDAWHRHGGISYVEAPAGTTSCAVEIATGASHTGEVRVDEVMLIELS
jgi:hypothetical protein